MKHVTIEPAPHYAGNVNSEQPHNRLCVNCRDEKICQRPPSRTFCMAHVFADKRREKRMEFASTAPSSHPLYRVK